MSERDFYWLVGLLEGEGSFCASAPSRPNAPVIALQMTDKDVMSRAGKLLTSSVYSVKRQKDHHKDSFALQVRGSKAVFFMKLFLPHMGIRRTHQIERALASYDENVQRNKFLKLQKVTGEQIEEARRKIESGLSLRKVAKEYGINHETLRYRLKGRLPKEPKWKSLVL